MRNIRHVTVAAVATVLLLSPAVTAWSSFGSYEPDTVHDTSDWMWQEPGPSTADQIYFNAWSSIQTFVNANVGALETSNEAATMERHSAILGVWVDCNLDGYVGHVESALLEYRSELLIDDSVCPPVTGEDPDVWVEGAHNYNGWVSELVPIARPNDDPDNASDTRLYVDPGAKMWADQGLPDAPRTGGTCALNPFPRGTMQSTGGLMNYFDCRYDTIDSFNAAMALIGDPLGLSYPDPENAEGAPLDVDTFGDEHTDHAAVSVVDCSADPFLETGPIVNETGVPAQVDGAFVPVEDELGEEVPDSWILYDFTVPTIDPRTLNTDDPTLPGQTNQSVEELDDCDTSNDGGRDFYSLLNEDDWTGDGGDKGKTGATWSFNYHEGIRGELFEFSDVMVPEGEGAAGMPFGGGLGACVNLCSTGWYGIGNLVKNGPSTLVVRANLEEPGVDIAPGYHISYYAYVSPAVTATLRTPGGQGFYGAAQCGENVGGVHNGWNCDRTAWNLNGDGTPLPGAETLAFVGDLYTLRDIDCYDGSTKFGVAIGLPAYGNAPCARPS